MFFLKKEQNSVVLSDTVPPSSSPGHAAGEDISFFSSSLLLPAACPAKTRSPTPPHDEKLGESRPASHAHWPTNPAPWQASKALLPMRSNRAAIGTPPLPLPYKYHLAPRQGSKALLPMCSNRAAIGTPPLPLPYKYHSTPAPGDKKKEREDGENRKRGNEIQRGRKEYGEA